MSWDVTITWCIILVVLTIRTSAVSARHSENSLKEYLSNYASTSSSAVYNHIKQCDGCVKKKDLCRPFSILWNCGKPSVLSEEALRIKKFEPLCDKVNYQSMRNADKWKHKTSYVVLLKDVHTLNIQPKKLKLVVKTAFETYKLVILKD